MKKIRKRYWIYTVVVILVILGGVFWCITANKPNEVEKIDDSRKLVVYTSHEKDVYEPVIREFEERTGIWVEVVTGGSNELLSQIGKEQSDAYADVMFGGGEDSIISNQAYFEDWSSFSKFPVVFIYNSKLVYEAGVPQKWSDLLDSFWKGKIACADPKVSGSAYTAIATMIQILGKENSKNILDQFSVNCDGQLLDGSSKVIAQVSSGEKLIGITSEDKAMKAMAGDSNIGIIYPSEGTSAVPDMTAIVKNAKHMDNARRFLEFTTSEDVQQYIEDFCYRRAVSNNSKKDPLKKEIVYDLEWAISNKEEIISQLEGALKGAAHE